MNFGARALQHLWILITILASFSSGLWLWLIYSCIEWWLEPAPAVVDLTHDELPGAALPDAMLTLYALYLHLIETTNGIVAGQLHLFMEIHHRVERLFCWIPSLTTDAGWDGFIEKKTIPSQIFFDFRWGTIEFDDAPIKKEWFLP